jgi:diaminopimelate epimerase
MRIFNADGSEAETCGNGLRCLVNYVAARGLTGGRPREVSVETEVGVRRAKLNEAEGKPVKIQVSLGVPKFEARDIPVAVKEGDRGLVDIKSMLGYVIEVDREELTLNMVSMGNPHAVYFWQRPVAEFSLAQLGPRVEHHKIFPQRTNFEVARVLSRQHIEARVWERGVGETLACGSGAGAVAVAARLRGFIDDKVDIKLPGGALDVEWDGVGEVFLGGPAEMVFRGEWPEKTLR